MSIREKQQSVEDVDIEKKGDQAREGRIGRAICSREVVCVLARVILLELARGIERRFGERTRF